MIFFLNMNRKYDKPKRTQKEAIRSLVLELSSSKRRVEALTIHISFVSPKLHENWVEKSSPCIYNAPLTDVDV